ncbi:ribosomal protein [Diaporthe eres]|nr:ribosomal protein [Diaporthe eres]
MASLRPLKPLPDILQSLAPSSRGIGRVERTDRLCAVRLQRQAGSARPSESASARGPKFLRSRPSSDLSFNVACQTDERVCSTPNGPLLHDEDEEVPTGGAATGPLLATRPYNTARRALNIYGGSTFIFKLGKPSRCRDDHDLVIHTCRRCAVSAGSSQRQQSAESIKGAMVGPQYHDSIVGREEAVEAGHRTQERAEKLEELKQTSVEIAKLEQRPADACRAGEQFKQKKLDSLRRHLESLKIQADINDPAVKRKFEDGLADFSKPIYRHFAHEKWLGMSYKILAQRLQQFHIVPDVLSRVDPKMDVQLSFHGYKVTPGETVDSLVSEAPPNLRVQVFDNKERLVSVVVLDSDVPDPENDSFGPRLHFMAANVPLSYATKNISLSRLSGGSKEHLAVPWLPPTSQEGAPYHRLSVWLLEQPEGKKLDVEKLRETYSKRDGFNLRSFRGEHKARPFGFNIFRTEWDEGTAKVMERHGIPGAELVFRRKRVYSLKPPKKARGWEAKRQGPKYRQLWKYTKRIGRMSGGT